MIVVRTFDEAGGVHQARRRHHKYFVQRLAVAVGVWSGDLRGIEETAVAIGFAPCPDAPP